MNDLVIRNLDEGVIESLQRSALLHGRSLEDELRDIVTQAARTASVRRPLSAEEKLAFADRICAMSPPGPQTDSTLLIREDRDR
ncbi:FitA-like ribbon-helix-helix domain-containing protein [Azospirillum sp.]|uniref:FitA-like ribbon-helix-helix domain-containing protein n=1 Tax=Azospirillum sp. TaxID=34012 RepID=UPI002D6BD122|nr:hypothetical protein [Azospirillum sp.]HYD71415.1 hypothetical protein [Azospirillum sp.]